MKSEDSMESDIQILLNRRRIWNSKRILRHLYGKWFRMINDAIRPGKTLEIGGGSGNLKEYFGDAVISDIIYTPWMDVVLDAHQLPFKDGSFDNIVLLDVLHHLVSPVFFFNEAGRVLKPRGRIILIEPYVSLLSFLVYKFLHQEGMRWNVNPFRGGSAGKRRNSFQGNQAIPTLFFEKHREKLVKKFPFLSIVKMKRLDFFLYPLSGGFHNRSLCPVSLYPLIECLEKLLYPLNRILAFRLFIVIERI